MVSFLLYLLLLLVEVLRFLGNGYHSLGAVLFRCVTQRALHCTIDFEHGSAMAVAVAIVVIATGGTA